MIKAIILDLDNTIYEYSICHAYGTKKIFEYLNSIISITYDEFLLKLDKAKKEVKNTLLNTASSHNRILYFQKLLESLEINPIDRADIMYEMYWDSFFSKMKLRDGCIELFEYLKLKNIKIALCTDLTTYLQYKKINKLKISQYIDCIVTSEEVGIEKPNQKMFNTVINKLNIKKEECIYIGDHQKKDIEGAKSAGICAFKIEKDFFEINKEIERRVNNDG